MTVPINNNILNLVYNKWNNDIPINNGKSEYPNLHFWEVDEYVSFCNNLKCGNLQLYSDIILKYNKISDVYETPNQKFYYFISYAMLSLERIVDDNLIFTNEIKKCLNDCKNFNIVLLSPHEYESENSFIKINNLDINKEQIYIINNNYELKNYVKKYNSKINVHCTNFLPIWTAGSLTRNNGTKFNINKKNKFFMCFNRNSKIHRYSLLVFMKNNNLLDDTNWSFLPPRELDKSNYNLIFNQDSINFKYKKEIEYFSKLKRKISDYEMEDYIFDENNEIVSTIDKPKNYENSYVNIVTESEFLDIFNVKQVTEKSLKPFYYYQFPLILSTHHHNKMLRERYDFDFFDDIIDHSYDDEIDQKKRFNKFTNEIVRLYKNKESLINFYNENFDRFENNKNKVIKIDKDISDYLFLKKLI
jgi:hypothetical protein